MMQANSSSWHKPKSVMIVDDHPIVRRGVRALLECGTNFAVVGEAENGAQAVELALEIGPDIIVIDLSMPHLGGIEAIAELRREFPAMEILVFTLHRSDQLFAEALAAGARAYVCKSETEHLVPALDAVARREPYVSPSVNERLPHSDDEVWDRRPLTPRERQIVKLVAEGHSNREIARRLKISIKTTETHRSSAMRKTGTNSAAGLTLYAARNRIVDL
jgi:DNA-binding NarL/FixJ family response regulator